MAKKAPIETAQGHIRKQIKVFEESTLPDPQKEQLVNWATGLNRVLQTLEQAVDPGNPPPVGTAHAALIELGRQQRMLNSVLHGSGSGSSEGGAGEGGEETLPAATSSATASAAPSAADPDAPAAETPVAETPNAASVGV